MALTTPIALRLLYLKLGKCSTNPLRNQVLFFRSRTLEEFRRNILGQAKATMVYIKAIHCKNGLQNLLAEGLIFSFTLQASAQALDTLLNDATQRPILIMIGEVMAECLYGYNCIDSCGVRIVLLVSEAGGSLGNAIEIGRDPIDGIPLATGISKSLIDLIAILFHVDGYTFMAG